MHNIITFTLIILIVFSGVLFAEGWERIYGGSNKDRGEAVAQTTDGGYIIVGATRSFGAGADDVYLIKTNAYGDTLWTHTYGGSGGDWGYSVAQTKDGGYIIVGTTGSFGAGSFDVYLIKTDAYGNTLWTHTYGGNDGDWGEYVAQTTDGGYIIVGATRSFGAGSFDIYLIKTNAYGDILWTRTYGGSDVDWGYSVAQTKDGGYIIAGETWSFGKGSEDVYLIKIDAYGDTLWTRTYGGKDVDGGHSVAQTVDGGYIIAGFTESYGAGSDDIYLIKTDDHGDTLWTRTYGGKGGDRGESVAQTSDGGYVIVGTTESFGAGKSDIYLIKTNAEGDILWTHTYGGSGGEQGEHVAQTNDGYIIIGSTESFGRGGLTVYLIKTDSLGYSGIKEKPVYKPNATSRAFGWEKGDTIFMNERSYILGGEFGFVNGKHYDLVIGYHEYTPLRLTHTTILSTFVGTEWNIGYVKNNPPNTKLYYISGEEETCFTFSGIVLELCGDFEVGLSLFDPTKKINPYIATGVGFVWYDASIFGDAEGGLAYFSIPVIAGCNLLTPYCTYTIYIKTVFPMFSGGEVIVEKYDNELNLISRKVEKPNEWRGNISIGIILNFLLEKRYIIDSDKDNVPNEFDECPNTPPNIVVDERGCPLQHKIGKKKKINVTKELEEKGKFVTNDIHFEYNSHKIPPDAYPLLNEIGTALENHPNWVIEISGHTDNIGSDKYNQKLSEKRAKSVKKYLLANFDIDKNRIIAKGYGEKRPIASNETPEGRALNRRVEFKIIKRN